MARQPAGRWLSLPSPLTALLLVSLLASLVMNPTGPESRSDEEEIERVDPTTIQGKFMVGYQGWFFCPGDGPRLHPGHHGWLHWQREPIDQGGSITFDLWPSTRELTAEELYDVPGLTLPHTSRPAQLFSSRHPLTVRRHFRWMRQHNMPGVFLQRFLGEVNKGDDAMRRQRDEVGRLVRESAEKEGRVWAMMWDVSGVEGDKVEQAIKDDWLHMINNQRILTSPSYLHEDGRPVIVIWGLGFAGHQHDPKVMIRLVRWLRESIEGGVWLMAGTPTHWHRGIDDQDSADGFLELWDEMDAISPWAVGRYADLDGADRYDEDKTRVDLAAIADEDMHLFGRKKRDYVPVVFPGFSWKNLHNGPLNQIPRLNGDFLWRQIYNAQRSGAKILYGAMFDEYDEATALMPSEPLSSRVPTERPFLALDADGEVLPDDWYLRICSYASRALLRGEPLPELLPRRALEEFWNAPSGEPEKADACSAEERSGAWARRDDHDGRCVADPFESRMR